MVHAMNDLASDCQFVCLPLSDVILTREYYIVVDMMTICISFC